MEDEKYYTIDSCKELIKKLDIAMSDLNNLLKQSSDLGLYISINKEENHDNGKHQIILSIKNATYTVNLLN